jgi:hypothetical protein
MATCPRCLGPLSEGHKCRPVWRRKFLRRSIAALVGGSIGAVIQYAALASAEPPFLGFVIGGLLSFGLWEAMRAE